MSQTDSASLPSIDWSKPLDPSVLLKYDLSYLMTVKDNLNSKIDAKILERIEKARELKKLNDAFEQAMREGKRTDLMAKCHEAARAQQALTLEIEKRHAAVLFIREAIAEKQYSL